LGYISSFVDSHKLLSNPTQFTLTILRILMSPIQFVLIIALTSISLKLSGKYLTLTPKIILFSNSQQNKHEMLSINMACYILTKWNGVLEKPVICSVIRNFHLLWNPNVHYHVHKSPPPVLILSHMNSTHKLQPYFPKIHFTIVPHLCLGIPTGHFPSHFPTKF
jgi:hypothetical protein